MMILVLLKNCGQKFKMVPESLERRWRTLKRKTGGNVMLVSIYHFYGQRLLALEVIVEGTLKDPGRVRYLLDGCSLVSLGEEALHGRIEKFVVDVGLAHRD